MSENLTKALIDLLTAEFQEADLDETGYLTKSELKNAMLKKGKKLSDEVIEALIKDADTDGDGKLNLKEFLKVNAQALSMDEGKAPTKEEKSPTKEEKSPAKEAKHCEW